MLRLVLLSSWTMKAAASVTRSPAAYADHLQPRAVGYQPVRRLELRELLALADPVEGHEVLSLACATGWYGRQLLAQGARRVVGVDACVPMVEEGRRLSAQCGDRMSFQCMEPMELSSTARFDTVFAGWWLCRARSERELGTLYRKAAQLLRPGGQFLAVCNNPDYALALGDNSRYGVRVLSQRGVGDCPELVVAFDLDRTERVCDRQWSAAQHARAAEAAGLTDLQLRLPLPQAEDLKRGGLEFWQAQLRNPLSMVLSARR